MAECFAVVDATDWLVELFEAGGSEEKVWLTEPKTGRRALFKPNLRHDNAEQADHWPEKLASELAGQIGTPAARIDLAVRNGQRGCLSYDVTPSDWELQPGWVLLTHLLGRHDPMDKKHQGHTLTNIRIVLHDYDQPGGFAGPSDMTAFDVFVGYLVLDALIANRDRHPANWAVLRGPTKKDQQLSPSFDHATSLGFSLTDQERIRRMNHQREWEAFLKKGTAHRFEGCRRLSLVDFAVQGLSLLRADARQYWLDQLSSYNKDQMVALAESIPEMSEAARTFAVELVDTNRRRLLDA
ncbi:HipA domain-containing protein [Sphaerimonospora thailandensis]|uniref:HipA-like C-terminal domain-containing protein n=1 Tax=Sphaerimonospora thailandensis TaxID=795644 RepID=A0A8J3VY90_9ACTN|nr:HipA domain-containing protein [Sphaerimonospora thailandensis]GIH69754.1 hypothetical protein Mth01_20070 [Sphaerimonospora thailandensis]